MIGALDVAYARELAATACVLFDDWPAAAPALERLSLARVPADYVPGRFFERELPCLLGALLALADLPQIVVVDGYVWLDAPGKAGLGAHLYEALGRRVPVVGVAKNPFAGAVDAAALRRGGSQRPLYVSAVGLPLGAAVQAVVTMHGPYRIPTLLRRVDQLARQGIVEPAAEK